MTIRIVVAVLIAAIIVIGLTLCARAQTPYPYILPPAKYDYPYEGELIITIVNSTKEVQDICKLSSPRVACGFVWPHKCHIIIVKDEVMRAMGWNPLHIWRHEHAHCHRPDGWSNNHEGIRPHSREDDARWLQMHDARDLYRPSPRYVHKPNTSAIIPELRTPPP